jgi:hypothetical protein
MQRRSTHPGDRADAAPASVDRALAAPGAPLPSALRHDMEQRFGHDFSSVRVHTGAAAEQSTNDIDAQAYTVGHDVVFASGQYAPGTSHGNRLVAHELMDVVQQGDSVPLLQRRPRKRGARGAIGPKKAREVTQQIASIITRVSTLRRS